MKVKMILSTRTEARSPFWRPIKYSPFPRLGMTMLSAVLSPDDEVSLVDDHVETLSIDDRPDLVVIQFYTTNAYRAYALVDHYRAKGCHVALGGLNVTALPDGAAPHADSLFIGPGGQTFPQFLADLRAGCPRPCHVSTGGRSFYAQRVDEALAEIDRRSGFPCCGGRSRTDDTTVAAPVPILGGA